MPAKAAAWEEGGTLLLNVTLSPAFLSGWKMLWMSEAVAAVDGNKNVAGRGTLKREREGFSMAIRLLHLSVVGPDPT